MNDEASTNTNTTPTPKTYAYFLAGPQGAERKRLIEQVQQYARSRGWEAPELLIEQYQDKSSVFKERVTAKALVGRLRENDNLIVPDLSHLAVSPTWLPSVLKLFVLHNVNLHAVDIGNDISHHLQGILAACAVLVPVEVENAELHTKLEQTKQDHEAELARTTTYVVDAMRKQGWAPPVPNLSEIMERTQPPSIGIGDEEPTDVFDALTDAGAKHFGMAVRRMREALGLKQSELAEELQTSASSVSRVETDGRPTKLLRETFELLTAMQAGKAATAVANEPPSKLLTEVLPAE